MPASLRSGVAGCGLRVKRLITNGASLRSGGFSLQNLISAIRYELIDTLFDLMKQSLQNGEDVLISRFGKFSVKEKQAYNGMNPLTGKAMTLAPRKVVTFKCSAVLRAAMNGESE
ncbi:hypothetical protein SBDP1_1580010 [Syntrophobacter sp. SbD1]|nr:hypothetical protein SBDP1_1580010 [Syntrophobacter sp. SbD1]